MTEVELIERCRKKDSKAQSILYELYSRKMMSVCLRYSSDIEDAKDLLQEGFVKVFSTLESYAFKGSFEGWVRRVFVNTALENLRKSDILKDSADLSDIENNVFADNNVIEELSAKELLNTIAKLPMGYRTVFNMYAIEGYSYSEIAKMLEVEESTCRSRYLRARKMLQRKIQEAYSFSTSKADIKEKTAAENIIHELQTL
ncbi:MAG: RNA polymerase sigma factor [Bacteroidales bacterium]|nr:RNA polymerase sigma factor [Bacteroidales bacterium]